VHRAYIITACIILSSYTLYACDKAPISSPEQISPERIIPYIDALSNKWTAYRDALDPSKKPLDYIAGHIEQITKSHLMLTYHEKVEIPALLTECARSTTTIEASTAERLLERSIQIGSYPITLAVVSVCATSCSHIPTHIQRQDGTKKDLLTFAKTKAKLSKEGWPIESNKPDHVARERDRKNIVNLVQQFTSADATNKRKVVYNAMQYHEWKRIHTNTCTTKQLRRRSW